ncbi:MAG: TldD/PmbA family protein [Erysipelotrichales bacterium]|nr:TldD/PmbA family protein [Erysipelotrichales bacterium]
MLSKELCQKVLQEMLTTGGDFAEIYEQKRDVCSYQMINGVVEEANSGTQYGIGLRIYQGFSSVYAYTNLNNEEDLLRTARDLAQSVEGVSSVEALPLEEVVFEDIHQVEKRPTEYSAKYKLDFLHQINEASLAYDPIIKKAITNYSEQEEDVLIANSTGKYIHDNRIRVRISAGAVAADETRMQDAIAGPGAHMGLEFFDTIDPKELGEHVAQIAKTMFYAEECPSGVMDVVIGNKFGGVIFHEACGHALEATSVAKNQSVFANKIGTKIAADCVSAVDDATIPHAWGSNNIDDEGNFTKRNLLIENGILKGYLVDQLNGRRMNCESSGSGRRQNYKFEPTSRMSNTFILNGRDTFEEMIANTQFGLYAKSMGGGSVDPSTGDFNFSVSEGYMIRDGKIAEPVRGATLVGNGAKVLMNIDMVGDNLARAQGMCGSVSGNVPTDVGQPVIRVRNMTVGGRGGAL